MLIKNHKSGWSEIGVYQYSQFSYIEINDIEEEPDCKVRNSMIIEESGQKDRHKH